MFNLAKQTSENRIQAFTEAAVRLTNMNETVIEKDYYVVLMMDILFNHSKFAKHLTFKGGTSLSKSLKIIERFSEDIDLILDWRVLGYEKNEPWEERSKKAQLRFISEMRHRTSNWIKDELIPELNNHIDRLGCDGIKLNINEKDPRTIEVSYSGIFQVAGILQEIRLEIGPLSAWTPHSNYEISPYISEVFPQIFEYSSIQVPTVEGKRTFWEKATILHKEANRKTNHIPPRYFRHYYDLYMMSQSDIKKAALEDLDLLRQVAEFKIKFFADNTARYEDAKNPATLKLIPPESQMDNLQEDYIIMGEMMFGVYPPFDEIMEGIRTLENEINAM